MLDTPPSPENLPNNTLQPQPAAAETASPVPIQHARSTIAEAIKEAETLLTYAASRGLSLPAEVIKTVVASKALLNVDTDAASTFELQAEFWNARQALAEAVQPVTIPSLNATTKHHGRGGKWGHLLDSFFGRTSGTQAEAAVRVFRRRAFWALFVLLIIQIYWIAGSEITKQIEPLLQQVVSNEQQGVSLKNAGKSLDSPEVREVVAKAAKLDKDMLLLSDILQNWNNVWQTPLSAIHLIDPVKPERSSIEPGMYFSLKTDLLMAHFISHGLEVYILPLLYGFLGACLYVLRTLSNDIRLLAYTPEQETLYRLRVYMGTLAGLIITWFLPVTQDSSLKSITPFALAFLVGYSVDLLFSLLDKLIATFSNK